MENIMFVQVIMGLCELMQVYAISRKSMRIHASLCDFMQVDWIWVFEVGNTEICSLLKWKQLFLFILSRRPSNWKEKHEIDLFSMDHWHMSNESKLR